MRIGPLEQRVEDHISTVQQELDHKIGKVLGQAWAATDEAIRDALAPLRSRGVLDGVCGTENSLPVSRCFGLSGVLTVFRRWFRDVLAV